MAAEKYPPQFMVLEIHWQPVSIADFDVNFEGDNPYIFNDFDKALDIAVAYQKKWGCPTKIVMLSILSEDIVEEDIINECNGMTRFEYMPKTIMAIENAIINAEELEILTQKIEKIKECLKAK